MVKYARSQSSLIGRFFPATPPVESAGPWLEVRQIWGDLVLDARHFRPGDRVTVGDAVGHRWSFLGVDLGWVSPNLARVLPFVPPIWSEVRTLPRVDFHAPEAVGAVPLATWVDEGWVLWVDSDVELEGDGPAPTDADSNARRSVPVRSDSQLDLTQGTLRFELRAVESPQATERVAPEIDRVLVGLFSAFAGMAALLALLVWTTPEPPLTHVSLADEHVTELVMLAPPKKKDEKKPTDKGVKTATPEPSADATPARGKRDRGENPRSRREMEAARRQRDREVVESAGLLSAMRGGNLEELFGSGSLGDRLIGAADGLIASRGGGGPGGFGLGDRGLGRGGDLDGLGDVWGDGTGRAPRDGVGGWGDRKRVGPKLTSPEDGVVIGSLDRAQVDEVVKRHLGAIKYCYQRELQREPDLAGKVVVKFVIAGDGSVSSARVRSTTIGHEGVEQCVVGRFLRMSFPEPRGGGVVLVSYPFLFSPG